MRFALAILCLLLSACVPITVPTPTAVVPAIVNDPDVITQLEARNEARIESCDQSLTSIQRERGLNKVRPFFDGRTIALTGTVDDARNMNQTFDAIVALDKVEGDIRIQISEELALSLNRGTPVLLEGQLKIVGCGGYDELTGTLTVLD